MNRRPPKSTPFPYPTLFRSPMLNAADTATALVRKLVHADSGLPLIQCLDPAALMRRLQPSRVAAANADRKSTRLNSSHSQISYAVFCLKKKKTYASRRLLVPVDDMHTAPRESCSDITANRPTVSGSGSTSSSSRPMRTGYLCTY